MLINIEQIKVTDRIRKDLGNLQGLADNIEEIGLINPPVVTPDTYELIAGERRLRAMKLLGYQQVEVKIMSVKDAEHQLNIEISENEDRLDFSKIERIDYGKRLERIEKVKAEKRRNSNLKQNETVKENFPSREDGQVRDIVAQKIGIGSGKQYDKEKYIADNATPTLLSQWDKGDISTHAAYIQIKKEKEALENKVKQLESQPPKIIEKEIEIDNTDYTSLENKKNELAQLQIKYNLQQEKIDILNERATIFENNSEKYNQLKEQIEDLTKDKNSISEQIKAATSLSGLIVDIKDFLSTKLSPIKYSRAILEMEENPTVIKNISNIVECVQEWCDEMKNYLSSEDKNNVIDINMEEK
jgi:ParB family chromosome partitioning protein